MAVRHLSGCVDLSADLTALPLRDHPPVDVPARLGPALRLLRTSRLLAGCWPEEQLIGFFDQAAILRPT